MKRENKNSEQGAILILLVLFATILLMIAGLAIDSSLIKAVKLEQSSLAPSVAGAALTAYSRASCENSANIELCRIQSAQTRAEQIAKSNIELDSSSKRLATMHSFVKDPSLPQELGPYSDGTGISQDKGKSGYIAPGVWHFKPSPGIFDENAVCIGSSPCPCSSGSWNGPCFEQLSLSQIGSWNRNVNSFFTELKLREDSPLQTIFMGAGGVEEIQLSSTAMIAARAVRAVFLVDLSRAAHQDTHLPVEIVGSGELGIFNSAESAYRIISPASCKAGEPYLAFPPNNANMTCITPVGSYTPPEPCPPGVSQSPVGPTNCIFEGGEFQQTFDKFFNNYCGIPNFPPNRVTSGSSIFPACRHARNDYRCYPVSYRANGVSTTENYLVDSYRGATRNGPYLGPEPLTTMLAGVQMGLAKFEERKLVSDYVGVIGFDHNADIDIRTFPLTNFSDLAFQELKKVFNQTMDDQTLIARYKDHLFFPRADAKLNLPEALLKAYELLVNQPDTDIADNFIILLIAGKSDCYQSGASTVCDDSDQSIQRSIDFARNNLAPNNIRLSIISFGTVSGTHSILRKGNSSASSGRCMSLDEMQENQLPLVDSVTDSKTLDEIIQTVTVDNANGNIKYNNFDFSSNRLVEATVATKGIWGPVRTPCSPVPGQLSGGSCSSGGLQRYLNSQCSAGTTANIPRITDPSSRLMCDPLCQDRKSQVAAYLDKIFARNPYIQVNDNIEVD